MYLFVFGLALVGYDGLDAAAVAVLLLVNGVGAHDVVAFALGELVERVLVDGARSLVLLLIFLEASEGQAQLLVEVLVAKEVYGALVGFARRLHVAVLLLELGKAQPILGHRVHVDHALVEEARSLGLLVAQLELDVRVPRLLVRMPLHPALEYLPTAADVAQHLLHVRVLVPELVGARQHGCGAVEQVARVVDLLVAHLHLGILEPQRYEAMVDVERSLPYGARSLDLLLRLLPLRVLDPVGDVQAVATYVVLELLALLQPKLVELLRVGDLLLGRLVFVLKR